MTNILRKQAATLWRAGLYVLTVPKGKGISQNPSSGSQVSKGSTVYVVISQSPGGGSSVAAGSTVTICVSSGSSEVSIPNVVGKTESSATNSLSNAGFSVSVSYEYSSSVSSGRVISQSSTGTGKKGSTITITVSKGAEQTETKTETTTKAPVSDDVTSGSSAR